MRGFGGIVRKEAVRPGRPRTRRRSPARGGATGCGRRGGVRARQRRPLSPSLRVTWLLEEGPTPPGERPPVPCDRLAGGVLTSGGWGVFPTRFDGLTGLTIGGWPL